MLLFEVPATSELFEGKDRLALAFGMITGMEGK